MANESEYDMAIIGSGPAGYVAGIRAGQLGLRAVVIEADDKFGGTCLHVGCIPTKDLLFNAEVYGIFQNAADYGIRCKDFSLDWPAIQARKDKIVKKLAQGVDFLLRKNKVETIRGIGRLAGGGRITINSPKGVVSEIRAAHIVLATGSEARMLPGLQADSRTIVTNREVLALRQIPRSMAVIGAGAVGMEFASIFHRFGTKMTIFEMLPRVLPLEDDEASAEVETAFRKQGIVIHTQAKVERAAKHGETINIEFVDKSGKAQRLETETLLVAIGRAPNTERLGLENTRIKTERGLIKVDGFMRTEEPGVYAVGDIVAGSPFLAHVGHAEALVAVADAAGKPAEPLNYRQVPNCTYCEPEVASVGLTEREAREAGFRVRVGKFPFSANSKAAILGTREGWVKIVSDETYGEILGVHMVGPRVTEMIAEAVVAMRLEATAEDLAHAIHPHPTLSEAILEAAYAAHDQAIHI